MAKQKRQRRSVLFLSGVCVHHQKGSISPGIEVSGMKPQYAMTALIPRAPCPRREYTLGWSSSQIEDTNVPWQDSDVSPRVDKGHL